MCLNETKCTKEEVSSSHFGYKMYWNDCKNTKGYAGVGVLSKEKPVGVQPDGLSVEVRVFCVTQALLNRDVLGRPTHGPKGEFTTKKDGFPFIRYVQPDDLNVKICDPPMLMKRSRQLSCGLEMLQFARDFERHAPFSWLHLFVLACNFVLAERAFAKVLPLGTVCSITCMSK